MHPSCRARTMLAAAALLALAGSSGCSSGAHSHPGGASDSFDAGRLELDGSASTNRAACAFGPGALAADTVDPGTPTGSAIPINAIVVVMMENHSFDNYFSHLNQYAQRTDIESAPDTATNPDSNGQPVAFTHAAHLCVLDPNHEWVGTHQEIDQGLMDGFVRANDGYNMSSLPSTSTDPSLWSGARVMTWYDERDIPFYYQLASTFAIADHYHASVPGPTWPNRMYLIAGTSFGMTTNTSPDISAYPYPARPASILDELESKQIPWMLYSDGLPGAYVLYGAGIAAGRWNRTVIASFAQFQADAAAGHLPAVSFVDPNLLSEITAGAGTDEHPPGDIQAGQQFVSQVVQAVTTSPQWPHLALFVTHDEHGGFYDHVPPPSACIPDGIPPAGADAGAADGAAPFAFDSAGVRVMLIAVSPYAKAAYVGHHVYDHTSIARFIEARFSLPALTARDANAEPLTDLFDFSATPFATPPALTMPTVDPTGLAYCETTFGM